MVLGEASSSSPVIIRSHDRGFSGAYCTRADGVLLTRTDHKSVRTDSVNIPSVSHLGLSPSSHALDLAASSRASQCQIAYAANKNR